MNIKCHGVNYIRTGECNRCGACCKPKNCLHFSWKGNLGFCDVHETKGNTCTTCTMNKSAYFYKPGKVSTHQICVNFPNHPFLRVITEGICGYKFEPATEKDKAKNQKLIDTWQ